MNLPNRLTLLRIVLVPVTAVLVALEKYTAAGAVFIAAALTDFLDGYIARNRQMVTTFGKFADPLADKMLVLITMIMLTEKGLLPGWAVCVVALRELAVDGLRLVAAGKGEVVAASMYGKIKTNLQFFCVLSALFGLPGTVTAVLTVLMAAATLLSGIDYFYKLRHIFAEKTDDETGRQ